jgi:hypothetical protein
MKSGRLGTVLSVLGVIFSVFTTYAAEAGCPYSKAITAPGVYTLDVKSLFPDTAHGNIVDWSSLNHALDCAHTALGSGAGNGVTVVVQLPAGKIDLSKTLVDSTGQPLKASLDFSSFNCIKPTLPDCGVVGGQAPPSTTSKLVFQGAGMGSTIVTLSMDAKNHNNDLIGILATKSVNVTLANLAFTWPYMTVTQGTVVSATPSSVTVDIQSGFPSPAQILDVVNFPSSGRYLRAFTYYKQTNDPVTYCKINPDPVTSNGRIVYSQIEWSTKPSQPNAA